jgi:predicted O-linked N-acetylglucosamine transferase (SPINDLY family)
MPPPSDNSPPSTGLAADAQRLQAEFVRALALHQAGRLDEARAAYQQITARRPDHHDATHMLGVIALQSGDPGRALTLIDSALAGMPGNAAAWCNRGNALQALQRTPAALESYDRALALQPGLADAHTNRGNALQSQRRLDEALAAHDRAIACEPQHALAHCNRGDALVALGRVPEAVAGYERAVALRPDFAAAWLKLGVALQGLRRADQALASYDRVIALRPSDPEPLINRGALLRELGRLEDALACYDRAYRLDPARPLVIGARLHARFELCDWRDAKAGVAELVRRLERDELSATPFVLLTLVDSPALQLRTATNWTRRHHPAQPMPPALAARPADARIRLGYYSADFHDHATSYLLAELLERHDRERFEVFGFSFGPDKDDAMRRRVASAFDRFIEVRDATDPAIAQRSRELGVDIAVDLKGITTHQRAGIFACRAAPVQVGYLGYPGTMGADYIDYLIADRTLIPAASRDHYREKVVWLPHCYQPNDTRRAAADRQYTRAELGLPATGFVFCCFNNAMKIMPDWFDGWMRILHAVEGSVLWLFADRPAVATNLRREAAARGIAPERLVFAERWPQAAHLVRHRCADLLLDTYPCGAHTSASDALRMGLPVLARIGESFASRVAASLLTAVDLPELIVRDQAGYEALAVGLANDPARLEAIKRRLQANLRTSPLFDTAAYARDIEAAYLRMHERRRQGLAPDHIEL